MATYSRPGVYIQEVALPQTIQLPDTSNAVGAMTGALAQGPSAAPTLVSSWSDFCKDLWWIKRFLPNNLGCL